MRDENLSYGFLIERISRYGNDYVVARFISREDSKDYPRGCDHPLDGFTLEGHVYRYRDEPAHLLGFEPNYRDIYSIDRRKAERMAACLKKIEGQIAKDASRSPGEIYMSAVRAFKLSFAVSRRDKNVMSSYSDNEWNWWTVQDGKGYLESLVQEMLDEANAKPAEVIA